MDAAILNYAVDLANFATVSSLSKRAECLLRSVSCVWQDSWLQIPDCTCRHLCTARVLAALAASCRSGRACLPSHDDPTQLLKYDTAAGNGRLLHMWVSHMPVRPTALVRLCAAELLERAPDEQTEQTCEIILGYSDGLDLQWPAESFLTRPPASRWAVRLIVRDDFPQNLWFELQGRRVAVRTEPGLPRRRPADVNTMCLVCSGTHLQFFWSGLLAGTCTIPEEFAFPTESRVMHCYCGIYSQRGFRRQSPAGAVSLREPLTGEGRCFPTMSMRVFSTNNMSGPRFCIEQGLFVYAGVQHMQGAQVHMAIRRVAHLGPVEICAGFCSARCPSSVARLLQDDVRFAYRHAWGLSLRITGGRVQRAKIVRSWAAPADAEPEQSNASVWDSVDIRYQQVDSVLWAQTNTGPWASWSNMQAPRPARQVMPFLMVKLLQRSADIRHVLTSLTKVDFVLTTRLSAGMQSTNLLADVPWLNSSGDARGGATPTAGPENMWPSTHSSAADLLTDEGVTVADVPISCPEHAEPLPLMWVRWQSGPCTEYCAYSLPEVRALHAFPVSATEAAMWFLHTLSTRVPVEYIRKTFPMLPPEIRAEVRSLDMLPMRTSTPLFFPAKSQIDYRANCLHLCFTSLARWTGLWLSQCFLKICALRCRFEKKCLRV